MNLETHKKLEKEKVLENQEFHTATTSYTTDSQHLILWLARGRKITTWTLVKPALTRGDCEKHTQSDSQPSV